MKDETWIYQRDVAALIPCPYGKVPAIAETNNIRILSIPGCYTRYHKGDVLDFVASCIQGTGRVGDVADPQKETGNGPRLIRQESAGAAPASTHTKKAGCSLK